MKSLATALAVLVLGSSLPAAGPNILFLFADDQCHETIRALGHTDIETPNLDRLAARGTTFTHAYNMGSWSGAVCVASRTMLVTGRSVWSAQAVYQGLNREREAGRLWPQLMREAGYRTYMTGKWHVPTEAAGLFDVVRDVRAGMPGTVEAAYGRPREGEPDRWSPSDPGLGGYWAGGKHWREVAADHTIAFLDEAAGAGKPFFIYAAFNAPHDPRQSPKEYLDRYPLERIEVPRDFLPEYPNKDAIGCGPTLRDERLAPFPRTAHAVKVHRREYYALITHLDAQIGRILDALDRSGRADDTWIFFTADHGLAVGHHGLFGKQNLHDPSVRVPFIVAGPGVPRNQRLGTAIYLQDVMATALDLAGVARPGHVFFHSLRPLLGGGRKSSPYDSVFGAYLDLQRSVTHEGWKLIAYPRARVLRLYHLAEDPAEMNDLAAQPIHAERRKQLFERLVGLQGELGDALDLRRSFAAP